jgi:hypothetical protein
MASRLLSLLTDIERTVRANEPAPDGGNWDTLRLINFRQGLARLTLSIRSPARVTTSAGSLLLQGFSLADGSLCVKASLSWQGTDNAATYAVYAKPETNWRLEAAQIAEKWLDGRLAGEESATSEMPHGNQNLAAAG